MAFAEVAVDAPAGYDRTFTYAIPPSLTLSRAHLVQVPFGPRRLHGLVFEVTETPQVQEPREVMGLVERDPLLDSVQLELVRWMSHYYMAPLFEVAVPLLPPEFRARSRAYLATAYEPISELPPELQRLWDYLERHGPTEESRVVRNLGGWSERATRILLRRGLLERSWQWNRPRVGARYDKHLRLTIPRDEARGRASVLVAMAPRQALLLRALSSAGEATLPLAQVRKEYGDSAVKGVMAKGMGEVLAVRRERNPLAGQTQAIEPVPLPTPAQARALTEVYRAMDDPTLPGRTFLLEGVTGSGKTEVYLQALAYAIERGRRAILLVPEISLTPQMVARFTARFPGQVAVLHSGLSPGEQFDQWWRIKEGAYPVVIGPRSAVFAPQPDLGLLILDEEHEWTYKQHDPSPRYHARDVALKLAELTGAVVLLGSATPDVVTHYRAVTSRYRLLELPERVGAGMEPGSLASVQVVDMRRELREGHHGIFSRVLQEAMGRCLTTGGRAILFLNRRGAATVVQCRDCGHAVRCRSCDANLIQHLPQGRLVCHQCNRRYPPPATCPQCGSHRIRYLGLGTQRVVEEVSRLFPLARVIRWDRDTASDYRDHRRLLERFSRGAADVLVGTQMVAKGLHIPAVTLVGAILADVGLNHPDIRAGERAFQVLCQVAGRAGRGSREGRVVIQTYAPEHYAIVAAAQQDYLGFYRTELEYRRQQGNPPFSKLIRLIYIHTNEEMCRREAERLAAALRHQARVWGLTQIDLIGPAPAYPQRVRGHYRWHLILRGGDPRALMDKVPVPRGWIVDVDPVTVV